MWSTLVLIPTGCAVVHPVLNAPNVLTVKLPPCGTAMRRAKEHFDRAILPHLEAGLIEALDEQPLPCRSLRHETHGNFFVMKGGSSTDPTKAKSSDLAWISVDDLETWRIYRDIFGQTGVAEAVAGLVSPLHRQVQLYSSFYVVRSHCTDTNWHADWPVGTGTRLGLGLGLANPTLTNPNPDPTPNPNPNRNPSPNANSNPNPNLNPKPKSYPNLSAWTLLAPLESYDTSDFQLLYKDCAGVVHQYRYEEGEAILFGSHFMHSTEPGTARRGAAAPHAFLCFTFGSDDLGFYEEHVAPTISGYQSRILVAADGSVRLTEIGEYLENDSALARSCQVVNTPLLV
jgi:hypothetical protein